MAPSRGGGGGPGEKFFLVREKQNIREKFDMKQLNGSQKITLGRVIGMCKFFFFLRNWTTRIISSKVSVKPSNCEINKQKEKDNLTD